MIQTSAHLSDEQKERIMAIVTSRGAGPLLTKTAGRPSDDEIIGVVAREFRVDAITAIEWMAAIRVI